MEPKVEGGVENGGWEDGEATSVTVETPMEGPWGEEGGTALGGVPVGRGVRMK